MEFLYHTVPLTLKHVHEAGHFWGYASTACIDRSNDQIVPGAFQKTLTYWKTRRGRWPHLYSEHNPEEFIGVCQDLREDETGLYVQGKLFLELLKAREVHTRLQRGTDGLSIGFFVLKSQKRGPIRQILDLDLKEISFVQNPCNPEAQVQEFKTYGEKESLITLLRNTSNLLRS